MNRKAVLVAVVFLVSTLGLLVTPVGAQPSWRVYGWGAVRRYRDIGGWADVSGGFFFSAKGDKCMVWLYFRDPYTNELIYITLYACIDCIITPNYVICTGDWGMYVDWLHTVNLVGTFGCDWRQLVIMWGPDFEIRGSVMFSRVRPYYIIT